MRWLILKLLIDHSYETNDNYFDYIIISQNL